MVWISRVNVCRKTAKSKTAVEWEKTRQDEWVRRHITDSEKSLM